MATATVTPAPTSPADLAQNAEKPPGKTMPPVASVVGARECVMEPKFDGWRLLVNRAEDGVHLYTRSGECQDGKLPALSDELAEALPPGTWLDGEIAALKVNGETIVNEWNAVQRALGCTNIEKAASRSGDLTFVAFDLIAHGGIDARPLPLRKRRALLERVFEGEGFERATLSPQLPPTDENLGVLIGQGFEGAVVKDLDSRYASGKRGWGWTKFKPQVTDDFVVMGFKEGEGGFEGLIGAVVFGAYEDGKLVEVGRCSGMDFRTREKISANRAKLIGTVIEVAHEGATVNSIRFPQFRRFRPDKAREECVI